jgi:ANTAR domain
VSDDAAFDILRRTSQDTNVKLADVAADVVRGRSRPAWKTGAWTSRARAAVARQ